MSKIRHISTTGTASPLNTVEGGLTAVAILCEAPDGWRVYEAVHFLRLDHWEHDKALAVAWTHRHGNKLSRKEAAKHFVNIPDDWAWAA